MHPWDLRIQFFDFTQFNTDMPVKAICKATYTHGVCVDSVVGKGMATSIACTIRTPRCTPAAVLGGAPPWLRTGAYQV